MIVNNYPEDVTSEPGTQRELFSASVYRLFLRVSACIVFSISSPRMRRFQRVIRTYRAPRDFLHVLDFLTSIMSPY